MSPLRFLAEEIEERGVAEVFLEIRALARSSA